MEITPPRSGRSLLLTVVIGIILLAAQPLARAEAQGSEQDVRDARTSFERGVVASRSGQWEEARVQFQRSLTLVPKASTMFNLAIADIRLGLGREALEQLEAFGRAANEQEHAEMLARVEVLRAQAEALVSSAPAAAQNGDIALSQRDDELGDEAREEVERARALYAEGRDSEALARFERAYRLSGRPGLLYNIGVVADRMRDDARAARAYEMFEAALPDAPEAAVARVRAASLRAALSRAAQADASTRAALTAAPRGAMQKDAGERTENPRLVPRTLIVTGSVLVATAGGTLGWYLGRADAFDSCEQNPRCSNRSRLDLQRKAALATTISSAGLGLALTTAGAVLLSMRRRAQSRALIPMLGPSLAFGVALTGTL